jgi:gliding motility-associated lipoprotein GldH
MRVKTLKIGLLLLAITVLFSCDPHRKYDQYKAIASEGWKKNSTVSFDLDIQDTLSKNNLFLTIRNNSDYRYNNLFLIAEMHYPNGQHLRDTLEYKMADAYGNWLGQGYTDIKESKLYYKEKFVFPMAGNYQISLQQVMRQREQVEGIEFLKGILDVGFRIEECQE